MSKTDSPDAAFAELGVSATAEAELMAAVQSAVRFLTACVDGQVAGATVGDRIAAAKVILEHVARQPDLLSELAGMADKVREEDVVEVLAALD